ncbi:helicase HerA domain-containing protein [Rubritalea spongiae]|uniref:Helicase HerA domain-containing protein n=1 Tax=Rubritalea spongiae TaxID=430797 RepID=A0ABW5DYZ2_9BACT
MQDYEKLGSFYLGREYDLGEKQLQDELVLYDSKDLVTHGVVLGMTGSGKTGLCLSLLEEAAMDNIPAIVIDPKGDIANLMLTFPEFEGSDFRPWVNESDALKKGMDPDDYAEKTAKMWEKGVSEWGQSSERVKTFKENVDINIFTPGSRAGVPVSILGAMEAPPFEVLDDAELLGDYIESSVSSLLSLVGHQEDQRQSHEAVLLGTIFNHYWQKGKDLSIESLIHAIQQPPFDKVGVIDLESYYPQNKRQDLAIQFNNLLASPGFSTWMEGPSLDIQKFLYQDNGKARISIFSIAHLSDSERMFFVSTLLNRMLAWMRMQNGTTSLRALLYMDEIYGYLPPTANPASKKPLMTILKQGRAFGLGALLATQNPVDLDYKALSNIGTWWLGRLQTERDKMRVLDGLQGAAAGQEGGFDRKSMEVLLAGLGSRVFLMNNVHEDHPVVFHVRWVMSYLCGPLTKRQIKTLMNPKRDAWLEDGVAESTNPMVMGSSTGDNSVKTRPVVGNGVEEYFAPAAGEVYQPTLLREATVYFSNAKTGVEGSRVVRFVNPIEEKGIDWDTHLKCPGDLDGLANDPEEGVSFADLPGYAMHSKNYKAVEKEFVDWIYRNERVEVFYAPLVKEYSKLGESEGSFRARIGQSVREERDIAVDKMRDKMRSKLRTKEGQLQRALAAVEREKSQAQSAQISAGASVLSTIFGTLLGSRKLGSTAVRRGTSAARSASRALQQRRDVELAEGKVEDLRRLIEEMENELAEDVAELAERFDPAALELEEVQVKPYKKDITVQAVGILWMAS